MFLFLLLWTALSSAEPDAAVISHPHGHVYAHEPYCSNGGACVPPALCAPWYLESLYDPSSPCYIAHGTPGVCCVQKKGSCNNDYTTF